MKTSLAHLPEKKQLEINHLVTIIRDIVDPEMIILFGSYAKGKQVDHRYQGRDGIFYEYVSDYDFLVVVNNVGEETSNQEWAIEEKAQGFRSPVNLEIHEVDYINKGLEVGQYFFADIVKEGIVLYDKGTVSFAKPRELTIAEKKQIAQDYFEKWSTKGNEFLIDALNAYQRRSLSNAVFYLHQATESFYYTLLLVFTGYKPKTHNLAKLRRKAKPYSEELFHVFVNEQSNEDKYLFDILKKSYVDARYKKDYVILENEVSALLQKIDEVKNVITNSCLQRIDSLNS